MNQNKAPSGRQNSVYANTFSANLMCSIHQLEFALLYAPERLNFVGNPGGKCLDGHSIKKIELLMSFESLKRLERVNKNRR